MINWKSIKRTETARQAYIRILSEFSEHKDVKDREVALCAELIRAGYLDGQVLEDSSGCVDGCSISRTTLEGHIFEQNMRKLEREESLWGRSLGCVMILVGYIFGVLSPLFADLVTSCLK
jgi:hypothetical protein